MNKTQIKLIEAAELEFAENGFHGASVRDITSRAEANIAAVNYHFGSKETLFIEMIRYRLEPINALRLEMLEAAVAKAGKRTLKIRRIIDIMVRPLVESFLGPTSSECNRAFLRAMGRGMSEESKFMKEIHQDIFAELVERFKREMKRSLPDLPEFVTDICFAYLRSTLSGTLQMRRNNLFPENSIQFPNADNMVAYISGGIEAIVKQYRTKKP